MLVSEIPPVVLNNCFNPLHRYPDCHKMVSHNSTKKNNIFGETRMCGMAVTFTEMDSNENIFNLESLKGKVILLNISAFWCGPCRRETPELVDLYEK